MEEGRKRGNIGGEGDSMQRRQFGYRVQFMQFQVLHFGLDHFSALQLEIIGDYQRLLVTG